MPQTKVRRITAKQANQEAIEAGQPERITGPGWAVWILSRFPGVRYRYQPWGKTKRSVIAVLLYLVALPIIPIVFAAVWYAKDPEGFKKSPLMPVLVAVIAAWLGGFGWVANQTPITDGSPYASVKAQADGESSVVNTDPAAEANQVSKEKIAKQSTSNATSGRHFENCTEAFDAGVFDIKRNDPSYERRLDRDNDGIACEK
ncbi:excalibur calcium-binding domain-containing protein [Candidatus Saccharibacteria bacterium]|nr:MAG: excalibur calcium-binding domain-containing protein [Candidatus Saccharibacteria bacterium]